MPEVPVQGEHSVSHLQCLSTCTSSSVGGSVSCGDYQALPSDSGGRSFPTSHPSQHGAGYAFGLKQREDQALPLTALEDVNRGIDEGTTESHEKRTRHPVRHRGTLLSAAKVLEVEAMADHPSEEAGSTKQKEEAT